MDTKPVPNPNPYHKSTTAISKTHTSLSPDSNHFQYQLVVFSHDVDSLYTNIETPLGLKAVRDVFKRYPAICESATRTLFRALRCRGYSSTFHCDIKRDMRDNYHPRARPQRGTQDLPLVPFISTFSPASKALNLLD